MVCLLCNLKVGLIFTFAYLCMINTIISSVVSKLRQLNSELIWFMFVIWIGLKHEQEEIPLLSKFNCGSGIQEAFIALLRVFMGYHSWWHFSPVVDKPCYGWQVTLSAWIATMWILYPPIESCLIWPCSFCPKLWEEKTWNMMYSHPSCDTKEPNHLLHCNIPQWWSNKIFLIFKICTGKSIWVGSQALEQIFGHFTSNFVSFKGCIKFCCNTLLEVRTIETITLNLCLVEIFRRNQLSIRSSKFHW